MSFESFGFNPRVMAGITSVGYTTPTPIQSQTIPPALEGRDVMGLAQTGTGKTAAFMLPILERLSQGPRRKLRVLIVTPTRELAEQIHGVINELGAKTGVKAATVYGGASMNMQITRLKQGVDIVVACPGRLLDHVRQGTIRLSGIEVLVLDEADRMLDMGFMPDVKKILACVPEQRQTMLFSATMPDDIRGLAERFMRDPVMVQVDHSGPASTVSHALYPVEHHLKTPLLIRILRVMETESVLVFARTRARTQRLSDRLRREGFSVASLEGDMPQRKRQIALDGFRDRKFQILVATDVAARGVDVLSISHVINFDMPDTPDSYTHRVGRTGRAERTGEALTLVTPEDTQAVRSFERVMGIELACVELEGFDYDVPPPADAGRPSPSHRRQRSAPPRQGRVREHARRGNSSSGSGQRHARTGRSSA